MDSAKEDDPNNFLARWLPLFLLGFIGMFLSEALIWNIPPLLCVADNFPLLTPLVPIFAFFLYLFLFVFFAHWAVHFKVNDWVGIVILGSLYGLINEGIFSDVVHHPGPGPNIFGVFPIMYTFPALSWHAYLDFSLGCFLVSMAFKNKLQLQISQVSWKECGGIFCFAFFWYLWLHSKILEKHLPYGLPMGWRLFWFLFPIATIAFLLLFIERQKLHFNPDRILGKWGLGFSFCFLAFALLVRFLKMPNKIGILIYACVVAFYVLIFWIYLKGRDKDEKRISIFNSLQPEALKFSPIKYFKMTGWLLSFLVVFHILEGTSWFPKLCRLFSVLSILGFILLFFIVTPIIFFKVHFIIFNNKRRATNINLNQDQS
ncbi:hypothetical protein ACFL35_17705 [Candidatus Riflebacteria bacterium]